AGLTPAHLWSAVDLLTPLAARCGDALSPLLAQLATGAEAAALHPRAQAVTPPTLHATKVPASPVPFLVGCEDGLLPLRLPGAAPAEEEIAEERRLFRVGITRARNRLYLSHAARRSRYGTEHRTGPSPFLDAIDAGLLERLGDTAPR